MWPRGNPEKPRPRIGPQSAVMSVGERLRRCLKVKEAKDVSAACGSGADPFCSDQLYGQAMTLKHLRGSEVGVDLGEAHRF